MCKECTLNKNSSCQLFHTHVDDPLNLVDDLKIHKDNPRTHVNDPVVHSKINTYKLTSEHNNDLPNVAGDSEIHGDDLSNYAGDLVTSYRGHRYVTH